MSIIGCNRLKNNSIKKGFTIIEVSLFLAITGLIFVGMVAGIQSSLTQNHYDDDVRALADFLQNAYSKVISVENDKTGTSNKAIYGKLITFGEAYNLAGEDNTENRDVFIYDVIGNIGDNYNGSTLASMIELAANVTIPAGDGAQFAGVADSYRSRWGTTIETINTGDVPLKATVLILRSPTTGNVFTYANTTKVLEVNKDIQEKKTDTLFNALRTDFFSPNGAELDICINMNHKVYGGKRKNIRIEKLSRSSAGVNIIHLDDDNNHCL